MDKPNSIDKPAFSGQANKGVSHGVPDIPLEDALRPVPPDSREETLCVNDNDVAEDLGREKTDGRYVGEHEYARGGMGRILIAFDTVLDREVIIKELLPRHDGGAHASTEALDAHNTLQPNMHRFLREARITGSLSHPSIVPVYELGRKKDGTPYYTMKLVRGKTLAEAIGAASSIHERMQFLPHFSDLCQAVAYAHSRGVIHRDLKPANIMVGEYGETIVIDWGLARRLEDNACVASDRQPCHASGEQLEEDMGRTVAGAVLGTPVYMAPEQATGDTAHIDKRTDVYALGAILYEIITGKTPYAFTTIKETVSKISKEQPPPVETCEPKAPRTLAAVCARAMEKDPALRYPSAVEFSEEINRFLAGALVEAYDYRFSDHLVRYIKQHKRLLTAAALMTFVLLATLGISYVQISKQHNAALKARMVAENALAAEAVARSNSEEQERVATRARKQEEAARIEADNAKREVVQTLYNTQIALAASHIEEGRYKRARQLLAACPPEHRNWEWGRLQYVCNQDFRSYPQTLHWNKSGAVFDYILDATRDRIITEDVNGRYRLVQGLTSQEIVLFPARTDKDHQLCISKGGAWLLERTGSRGILYDMATMREVFPFSLMNHPRWSFDFSANDAFVAARTAPERVAIIALPTGREQCAFDELGLQMARLSYDGAHVATLSAAINTDTPDLATIVVRETQSGRILHQHENREWSVLAFALGSSLLVAGTSAGEITVWNALSPEPLWQQRPHAVNIVGVAFTPMNKANANETPRAAFLYEDGVLWGCSLETGRDGFRFITPGMRPTALAFSPDASRIAVGNEQYIYLYDIAAMQLMRRVEGHEADIRHLAFSADGELLYSVTEADVKIWRVEHHNTTARINALAVTDAALLSDSNILRILTANGDTRDWRLDDGDFDKTAPLPCEPGARVLLSPTGKQTLGETSSGLTMCNLVTSETVCEFTRCNFFSTPVAFSPGGKWLALLESDVLAQNAVIVVHDAATGERATTIRRYGYEQPWDFSTAAMAFSPNETELAVSVRDQVLFYQIPEGNETATLDIPGQTDKTRNVICFSPEGTRIAVSGGTNSFYVLDIDAQNNGLVRGETSSSITTMIFNDDGKRLVVGHASGLVTIRDTTNGAELLSKRLFDRSIRYLFFADTGGTLVAGDGEQMRLVYAFPWRETELPGRADDPIEERIVALKTGHRHIAPAWGLCQSRMTAMHNNILETATIINIPEFESIATTSCCPAGGVYSLSETKGHPVCSIHGPLRDPAHLLAQIARYENLNDDSDNQSREALRRALPDTYPALKSLIDRWVYQEQYNFRTAVLACDKGLEMTDCNELRAAKLVALLALGKSEQALHLSRHLPLQWLVTHGAATNLALAMAQRGTREDVEQACRLLCALLPEHNTDNSVRNAITLVRQSPHWQHVGPHKLLDELLAFNPENWHKLPWHASLETALQRARQSGKVVMVSITSGDSGAMRHLRETVYSHPQISALLRQHCELVALDAEVAPDVLDRFGIVSLPAHLFLDGSGALLRRHSGVISRVDFEQFFFNGFLSASNLTEWRIIGPFPTQGCPAIEAASDGAAMDFYSAYAGKTAEVYWKRYVRPPVFDLIDFDAFYDDAMHSAFYAFTCFELPERIVVHPDFRVWEKGKVWLNGRDISRFARPRDPAERDPDAVLTLDAGRHTLLVKIAGRWSTHLRVILDRDNPEADHGLVYCDMPPAPALTLRNPSHAHEKARQAAEYEETSTVHHITVNKHQVLREWRDNYGEILSILNPEPVFENGTVIGIRAEHPEHIAILAKGGFKNGDILTAVNGYRLGGDKSILDIAELTEGSNPYILSVLRQGEEHTFYVHVE